MRSRRAVAVFHGCVLIALAPMTLSAQLRKCVDAAGKTVVQDSACPETPAEATKRAKDASDRKEATRAWEERMRKEREEIAKKPIPKEAFIKAPWEDWNEDFNLEITKTLAATRTRGCGEYRHKSLGNGKFSVVCTGDGKTWTEYSVDTRQRQVSEPVRKYEYHRRY